MPNKLGLLALAILMLCSLLGSTSSANDGLDVPAAVRNAEAGRIETIERIAPAVVAIFGADGGGGGSGVLISPDGYTLTNFHVTQPVGDFLKCGLNDGHVYDAVIVGIDPTGDVALIKMLGRDDFPTAPLGNSDEVRVGDSVLALGNPFLLATDFHPTVTYGIVSGVHRYQYPSGSKGLLEYTDCIQVDASINPGNSGGPLFNMQGEVIGINGRVSFEKRFRVNSGVGYAISINQIKNFMGHLKSGRVVDHATLGATIYADWEGVIRFDTVLPSSEAARRGIQEGDELISFGNRPIRSVNQFKNILGIYPNGWRIPMVIRSDTTRKKLYVRLQSLHQQGELDIPEQKQQPLQLMHKKPVPPPEEYKHMVVKKSGFANYYFNEQEQKRTLAKLDERWKSPSMSGAWKLTGLTGNGESFEFTVSDRVAGLEVGTAPNSRVFLQQLGDDQPLINEPAGSGGLLPALHLLRQFLTQDETYFSEYYYLGTEPHGESESLVDVIIATTKGTRLRAFFEPETGRFLGIEFQLDDFSDSCMIEFSGNQGPQPNIGETMTVTTGGEPFAVFRISDFRIAAPAGEASEGEGA
ncbi:S1C family serine protease [Calycomorphotria hydatis]|nr:trypsin-like peptidase domain-containing protein [Calycomorphotria hydatis]